MKKSAGDFWDKKFITRGSIYATF